MAEHKQNEQDFRRSEHYARNIIESSLDMIIGVDRDRKIIEFNKAAEETFGYHREEVLGQSIDLLYADPSAGKVINQATAQQGHSIQEILNRRKNGEVFPCLLSASMLYDARGECIGFMGVSRDITERKRAEEALRTSEKRFRALIENSTDGIVLLDADNILLYASPSSERILGYHHAEMLGRNMLELVHPEDGAPIEHLLQEARQHPGKVVNTECRLRHKDGRWRWLEIIGNNLLGESGIQALVVNYRDVTERRQTLEALQHSTERLRILHAIDQAILAAQTPEIISQAALTHIRQLIPACRQASVTFLDWNSEEGQSVSAQAASINAREDGMRFSLETFAGAHILDPLRRGQNQLLDCLALNDPPLAFRTLQPAESGYFMIVPLALHGQLMGTLNLGIGSPNDWTSEDAEVAGEVANELLVAIHNARLLQQVHVGRELLQSLSHRLAEAQETERRRIARELHDQIGQSLTTLGINLNVIQSQLAQESNAARWVQNSLELLAETIKRTRDIMAELRPPVLDDYGLAAALRWYGGQFHARTGVIVLAPIADFTPRLPLTVETALFRITQEALTNVAKHAHARQVKLGLEAASQGARLTIADDGVGFDTQAHHRRGARREWGFITMRERSEAVGGSLRIQSAPGQGTQLIIEVPR